MKRIGIDVRTLETQLKNQSGTDFCTIKDVQAVTNMSYRQIQRLLRQTLLPIPHRKPYRFLIRHVAQTIVNANA